MTNLPRYQTLFADLKRRQVFKVAAVYGAVSFVVLQAADIIFPRLGLPDWTVTFVVAVATLGFPIAIVLAWAFDMTPEGVRRTDRAAATELEAIVAQPRARRWPSGILALVGTLLLLGGGWWVLGRVGAGDAGSPPAAEASAPAAAPAGDRKSIAVLPFADLSPEGDNEYFADGMAEEILNTLVKVRGLRVAARTSSFAFKGKNTDVRAVGEELGVQTVLEGSVRKEGDLLRITAQLINVADGFHLWSETYNRKLESVFAIQEEIAKAIVNALSVPLGLAGSEQLVSSRTGDVRGYELYLQGRFLFGQRGDALRRAISLFQEALARDSLFAPAYAGLAEAYALLPYYKLGDWEESLSRAEAAARRALAVDSALAEAHVALANVHRDRWQRDQAELHYRRALALSPENAEAHHQYAQYLTFVGRLDAGVEASGRALELDPLSPIVNTIHGWNLYFVRRYDDAIRQLERAVELDPAFPLAGRRLVWAYLLSSRYADAEREARRIAELERWSPDAYATLVRALTDPGQRPEALRILDSLEGEEGVIDVYSRIAWFAVLGEQGRALDLVELHWRPPGIIGNNLDPALDPLRDEPRFQAVLRRVSGQG